MAAAAALNVVKQIHALAEGPPTPEMRECLGQVVASLLFFLDHPDSRVRTNAARTLVKLSSGYNDDMRRQDMARARTALSRCEQAAADGCGDSDNEELQRLLTELLSPGVAEPTNGRNGKNDVAAEESAPTPPAAAGGEAARGEVVLKVGENTDGKVKAIILEKVIDVHGVVSVTIEGSFVIVSTKTPSIAADATFLADLLAVVKAQGLEGVSLVSARAATSGGGEVGDVASSSAAPAGSADADLTTVGAADDADVEDYVPPYLDDEEDNKATDLGADGSISGGAPGAYGGTAQWSFFSQNNWMTGRRLQEFGDDPTIAARLAKAKKREEEKRQEEKSKIGKLSSWLSGW